MRGRKPKPAALRNLQGNPGKRAIRAGAVCAPHSGRCPRYLDGEAKKKWKNMAALLLGMGLLTEADEDALALYCQSWSDFLEARLLVAALGLVVWDVDAEGQPTGSGKPNPAVAVADRAWARLLRLMAEFGLTPSARMRVAPAPVVNTEDPFEALLNGRGVAN